MRIYIISQLDIVYMSAIKKFKLFELLNFIYTLRFIIE